MDVGIYHPHEFGLVEIKNSATRSVVEDRPRLVEAMKAVPEWRFSAICFLHCDGHWRTPYKLYLPTLQSDADRDTWHCEQIMLPDNVPTRYVKSYICARSFQRA